MKRPESMNRSGLAVGALLLVCLAAIAGCTREHQSVVFFYEAICPSCEESQRMEQLAGSVMGLESSGTNVSARAFNVYEPGAMEALESALAAAGLEPSVVSFPVLIVGQEVYEGEPAVREAIDRLREAD